MLGWENSFVSFDCALLYSLIKINHNCNVIIKLVRFYCLNFKRAFHQVVKILFLVCDLGNKNNRDLKLSYPGTEIFSAKSFNIHLSVESIPNRIILKS